MKSGTKKLVKNLIVGFYRLTAGLIPVDRHLVVFNSNMGKNWSGNPKALYEYLTENYPAYRGVIILTDACLAQKGFVPPKGRVVHYGHPAYYWYMARAGIWVFDSRQEDYLIKKKNVRYLQTWHGTTLKKLGLDIGELHMTEEKSTAAYHEAFRRNTGTWDYLITQNPYSDKIFKSCFNFNKKLVKSGYPRNDVLFINDAEAIEGIKKKYGLPQDKKLLLYAPTWRDNLGKGGGWYGPDSALDLDAMYKAFGGEYVLLIKYHYLIKLSDGDIPKKHVESGFVHLCSNESDIAELYRISDMMITDYSSTMFDYNILQRPMIFFCYDLADYRDNLRGFYFDLTEEAPGPIATTTSELIRAIREYDPAAYGEKRKAFTEKYNTYEDGRACEKVWREVLKD